MFVLRAELTRVLHSPDTLDVLEFGKQTDTLRQRLRDVVDGASVVFRRYVRLGQESVDRVFARISDTASKRKWNTPWLTRRAVASFLKDQLEAAVVAAGEHDETMQPLKAVPAFQDTPAVANRLFDELVSLPWRYRLMLPLPFGTNGRSESSRFELADDFYAQTYDELEAEAITLHPTNDTDTELRNRAYPGVIDTDTVYFVHEPLGYIPCTDSDSVVEEFVHAWKAFMGLLSLDKRLVPWVGEPRRQEPALPIVIHRMQDDGTADLQPYKWLTVETTMTLGRFASYVQLAGC